MNNRPYELSDDVSSVIDDTASQATAISKSIVLLSTTTSNSKKIFLIKIFLFQNPKQIYFIQKKK